MEMHQSTHAVEETEEVSVSNNDKWDPPYSSTNNYDKHSQPAKSLVLKKKTKCLNNLSFQTEKKNKSRKSNKEKKLLPYLGNCPTIRNGVECRGLLKEYQKKTGKQDVNGKDLKATYLRCQKKGCQTYHSLSKKNIINKLSLPATKKNLDNREKLMPKKKISTLKNKTPAAKGHNRKNQGKAKKELKKNIKDDVNKNEKEMLVIKKKNTCKRPKIVVYDNNPEEKVNKQLNKIAINDHGLKLKNDFISGQFVVRKTDMIDLECPPIWKITNFGFLQKYLPFKNNGNLLYKGAATFAGWIPRVINQYYLAPITFNQHTSNCITFHKDQVEMESAIKIPTEEELTGVLEEALFLAVSQKIFKSQHEIEGLQAGTSNNSYQPDKNLSINKNKLGTTDKVTKESAIQDLNQKSTQSPIKTKYQNHVQETKQNQQLDDSDTSDSEIDLPAIQDLNQKSTQSPIKTKYQNHVQETKQNQQVYDSDTSDSEIDLPGQIPNIGSFIVNKTDIVDNNFPTLWKITNFGLLQKYCPFKEDDKMLYRNTLTYCSWNSEEKNHYIADVSTKQITQKDHIIKLNKIMRDLTFKMTVLEEPRFVRPPLTPEEQDLIRRVLF